MEFFGHYFSETGISPVPAKVKIIEDLRPPMNASEVRSLLGMANYCGSRFVKDYATLTYDLRMLTRKDCPWKWMTKHDQAFKKLKEALGATPALCYFDPERPTEIHVDASPVDLCAILMQVGEDNEKYTALAVVWACEHLHIYIMGMPIVIYTDHKPLVPHYNDPRSKPPARIERWMLRLQPHEVEVR